MRSVTYTACLALLGCIVLSSCKKSDHSKPPPGPQAGLSLIDEARNAFSLVEANATSDNNTGGLQPVSRKTPLWDKAYISHLKKGETVVVPLKYDKPIQLESNFGDGRKISLQDQSFLFMRKKGNSFETQVVSYLPDKAWSEGKVIKFSGAVLVHDWSGNHMNTFVYREGKKYKAKKGVGSNQASRQVFSASSRIECYYINWYNCQEDLAGNYYDCKFLSSTFLGCFEEGDDDNEEVDELDNGYFLGITELEEFSETTIEANSEDAKATFGPEATSSETQIITVNVGYDWRCGTGSTKVLGNFYNWSYWSYEKATLYKINRTDPWKFQTLEHSNILLIGQTPPTHEYSHQLGSAIVSYSADRRTANMEIKFVVYERIARTVQTKSWEKVARTKCIAP